MSSLREQLQRLATAPEPATDEQRATLRALGARVPGLVGLQCELNADDPKLTARKAAGLIAAATEA